MNLLDKHGREILPGDTLKVFHFVSAVRRERCFMYKFVEAVVDLGASKAPFMKISHLNLEGGTYLEQMTGEKRADIEIVQGYGADGVHFKDRPKP